MTPFDLAIHIAGPNGWDKKNRLAFLMTRMGDKKNNLNFIFLVTLIGLGVFVSIRMGGKKSNLICQFINKVIFLVTPFGLGVFVRIRMGDKKKQPCLPSHVPQMNYMYQHNHPQNFTCYYTIPAPAHNLYFTHSRHCML